jgi:hypothetical protein
MPDPPDPLNEHWGSPDYDPDDPIPYPTEDATRRQQSVATAGIADWMPANVSTEPPVLREPESTSPTPEPGLVRMLLHRQGGFPQRHNGIGTRLRSSHGGHPRPVLSVHSTSSFRGRQPAMIPTAPLSARLRTTSGRSPGGQNFRGAGATASRGSKQASKGKGSALLPQEAESSRAQEQRQAAPSSSSVNQDPRQRDAIDGDESIHSGENPASRESNDGRIGGSATQGANYPWHKPSDGTDTKGLRCPLSISHNLVHPKHNPSCIPWHDHLSGVMYVFIFSQIYLLC